MGRAAKFKSLRKEAEEKSVGLPYVKYETNNAGSRVLTETCERGIYRRLKKAARSSNS